MIVFIRRIDNVDVRKRFDFIELTYDISVDVICLRSNADAFAYVDYDVSDNRAFAFAFSENRGCSAVVVRRAVICVTAVPEACVLNENVFDKTVAAIDKKTSFASDRCFRERDVAKNSVLMKFGNERADLYYSRADVCSRNGNTSDSHTLDVMTLTVENAFEALHRLKSVVAVGIDEIGPVTVVLDIRAEFEISAPRVAVGFAGFCDNAEIVKFRFVV